MDYNSQSKHPYVKFYHDGECEERVYLRNSLHTEARVYTGFETSTGDPLYFGDTVWRLGYEFRIERNKYGAPCLRTTCEGLSYEVNYVLLNELAHLSIHPPKPERRKADRRKEGGAE